MYLSFSNKNYLVIGSMIGTLSPFVKILNVPLLFVTITISNVTNTSDLFIIIKLIYFALIIEKYTFEWIETK